MPLLPLEQRGSNPPNGAPPPSERVHLDSNLRRWFARNLGLWRSRRQYLFSNEEVFFLDMMIRVEIFSEFKCGEPRYRFSWWPDRDTDFFERKPSSAGQHFEGQLFGSKRETPLLAQKIFKSWRHYQ